MLKVGSIDTRADVLLIVNANSVATLLLILGSHADACRVLPSASTVMDVQ